MTKPTINSDLLPDAILVVLGDLQLRLCRCRNAEERERLRTSMCRLAFAFGSRKMTPSQQLFASFALVAVEACASDYTLAIAVLRAIHTARMQELPNA